MGGDDESSVCGVTHSSENRKFDRHSGLTWVGARFEFCVSVQHGLGRCCALLEIETRVETIMHNQNIAAIDNIRSFEAHRFRSCESSGSR